MAVNEHPQRRRALILPERPEAGKTQPDARPETQVQCSMSDVQRSTLNAQPSTFNAEPALRIPRSSVQRTLHTQTGFVHHMRVDLSGRHVLVSEQFLNGSDVVTAFQKMSGERMAQGMRRHFSSIQSRQRGRLSYR